MASGPEGTEPVNYQKSVLKVSIHCEECKEKLKKILLKVKGVYDIEIDAKQNRVTVTGDVDPESLIQKLRKYGKRAELLPEKKSPSSANSSDTKTEAKGKGKAVSAAAAAAVSPETGEKQQAKQEKSGESPEMPPAAAASSDEITVPKPDADADAPTQPEENNTADSDSKKKGKEVQTEEENREGEREVSASGTANAPPANSFPPNFQPVYTTVSYQTVHPSTSYAYYAAPPPEMPSSYAFYGNPPPPLAYPPPAGYSPEYYYSSESYYGSMDQPSPAAAASYDMFNDENPNACKLM